MELKGDYVGPREFRTQAAYYLKGISHSARTKVALNNAESEKEMDDIFDRFAEQQQERAIKRQQMAR